MVGFKKQVRLLFIPIINCSIIFIIVFKNKFFFKHGWQFKLFPYLLVSVLLYLPFSIINESFLIPYFQRFIEIYGYSWVINLISFYPFTVIASALLLFAQKRLIKLEHKETFENT